MDSSEICDRLDGFVFQRVRAAATIVGLHCLLCEDQDCGGDDEHELLAKDIGLGLAQQMCLRFKDRETASRPANA